MNKAAFITALARSITCGKWDKDPIEARIAYAVDNKTLNFSQLANALFKKIKNLQNIEFKHIEEALHDIQFFVKWIETQEALPTKIRINLQPAVMNNNISPFNIKNLPQITTYNDLTLWLGLTENDLGWLADTRNIHATTKDFKLQHYHYKWLSRPSKTSRLVESPKSCLKSVQRKILTEILDNIQPHQAAHGFTKKKSCHTHAKIHCGQDMILHLDLENFFTSITHSQVYKVFMNIGYPKTVARTLTALCVNSPSPYLLGPNYNKLSWQRQKLLTQPHLPQGAPTSPALANLCSYNLDKRLEGLAKTMDIQYSRYADDLALSGGKNLKKYITFLCKMIERIANDEGFQINHSKTYSAHKSQRQSLVGIVVNKQPNIMRKEYELLKATLHNCILHGPKTQNKIGHNNFEEYLRGKVAYIYSINPSKGEKLINQYKKIIWTN